MIKSDNPSVVRNNLEFLLQSGLVYDPEIRRSLSKYLSATPDSAIVRLPSTLQGTALRQRSLHVLTVGVNKYDNTPPLLGPIIDTVRIADTAKVLGRAAYEDSTVVSLIDKEATKIAIIDAIDSLPRELRNRSGDVVLIYLSGHGTARASADVDNPSGAFLLSEFDNKDFSSEHVITVSEILSKIDSASQDHYFFLFFDADGFGTVDRLKLSGKVNVFAAAGEGTLARESEHGGIPVGNLSHAVVEAFQGLADLDADRQTSVSELSDYLYSRVAQLSNGKQKPVLNIGFDGVMVSW